MKITIYTIAVLISLSSCKAQSSEEVTFEWNPTEKIEYKISMEPISTESTIDRNEPDSLEIIMKELILKKLKSEFGDFKIRSEIQEINKNIEADFFLGDTKILNGQLDSNGKLLTPMVNKHANFFKFFYGLPNRPMKPGDKWTSGIVFDKKFDKMNLTDSLKIDEVTLENIEFDEGDRIALLSFHVSENYKGNFKDERNITRKAEVLFKYKAKGFFNIDKGYYNRLEGIVIFEFNFDLEYQIQTMRAGLIKE